MYDKCSISQRVKINLFNLLGNKRSHRSCCLNVFDLQLKPSHCRLAGRPAHVALYCRILAKLFSEAVGLHGCLLTCMEGNSFFVCLFCSSQLSMGSSHSQESLLSWGISFLSAQICELCLNNLVFNAKYQKGIKRLFF